MGHDGESYHTEYRLIKPYRKWDAAKRYGDSSSTDAQQQSFPPAIDTKRYDHHYQQRKDESACETNKIVNCYSSQYSVTKPFTDHGEESGRWLTGDQESKNHDHVHQYSTDYASDNTEADTSDH
jgi:hypothetical protein